MTELTSHKMAMDWALCSILWSRHCSLASPNTYPTSLHASRSMICCFVTTIRLLPPVSVTDIVRFRRCRVPIDYFVATWPLAANETCSPSLSTSAMPMVLCERVRIHILCQFDAVLNQLVMGFSRAPSNSSWTHTNFVYFLCNSKAQPLRRPRERYWKGE